MLFFPSKLVQLACTPLAVSCLLIVFSCVALMRRRLAISLACNLGALAILVVLGNTFIEQGLLMPLEMSNLPPQPMPVADAIVVLGGVTKPAIFPQPTTHLGSGADRLLYAAQLYHAGKAPVILVSGGRLPWDAKLAPEATQMAELLQMMGVPASAILQESGSRNTHENAALVKQVMTAHHIRRVLLVTSAATMPRALNAFRREMIDVIPAPTDFATATLDLNRRDFVSELEVVALSLWPNAGSLDGSTSALHEYLGLLQYRLTGWI